MRTLRKCDDFEHINIEYEGGEFTLRFREYLQTIKMFKKVDTYGDDWVVLSSSAWYEREFTIQRGQHEYFLMLCNGALLGIPKPRNDSQYGDESVVIKFSNREGMDVD
jgi:hypothetical protein